MLYRIETRKDQWPLSASIGFLLWNGLLVLWLPWSPFAITHVQFLLLAAPLWLVPLAWRLITVPAWVDYLGFPAGLLFALAFLVPPGMLAASLALPWAVLCLALAFKKLQDWWFLKDTQVRTLCLLAASIYLPVGAFWGLADRFDFTPFGFSPTITLLTAVHFHYAGFVLPLITGLALREFPCLLGKAIGWGVIVGISLVAIGIITTHVRLPVFFEIAAVTVMTLAAAGAGMMHLNLSWRHRQKSHSLLWTFAGVALIGGMSLAFCYGWRSVFVIETLNIPWMYAVHGTLNAVGFAIPGLLGWWLEEKGGM